MSSSIIIIREFTVQLERIEKTSYTSFIEKKTKQQ